MIRLYYPPARNASPEIEDGQTTQLKCFTSPCLLKGVERSGSSQFLQDMSASNLKPSYCTGT